MKNIYILIIMIFALQVRAQNNAIPTANSVTLKGIVLDSVSAEPIPSVNIGFYLNEQLIKRAVSNNNGEFKVTLPKGNYIYQVSCVGFNTKKGTTDSILQNNKGFEIKLSVATNTTSEVLLKAHKTNFIDSCGFEIVSTTICDKQLYKPYKWLVINPSNYVRGPFLVPPKEKK